MLNGGDGGMSADERLRALARLGLDVSAEDVEGLQARFEEVDAGVEALRRIDVSGYEPHAVFAPEPEDGAAGG